MIKILAYLSLIKSLIFQKFDIYIVYEYYWLLKIILFQDKTNLYG